MVIGFTMINVLHGHDDEAYLALMNTKGVIDVLRILGEYHFFVIMHAENEMLLLRLIDSIKKMTCVTALWHILISKRSHQIQKYNNRYPFRKIESDITIH
jgi:hypothetical protein